jgi:hypothetical protein
MRLVLPVTCLLLRFNTPGALRCWRTLLSKTLTTPPSLAWKRAEAAGLACLVT